MGRDPGACSLALAAASTAVWMVATPGPVWSEPWARSFEPTWSPTLLTAPTPCSLEPMQDCYSRPMEELPGAIFRGEQLGRSPLTPRTHATFSRLLTKA